jgi:uncharacterized membrane protein YhaH (DUF805 family)
MGRRDYLIGLVGLAIVFTAYGTFINYLGGSIWGLFAVFAFPFVILQITYSVYGKRLHDIGRTVWPVTALISLIFLAVIVVMLTYGGVEYFEAFIEQSQAGAITDEAAEKLREELKPSQEQQENSERVLSWIVVTLLSGFSIWLALAKPDPKPNAYGPPPNSLESDFS